MEFKRSIYLERLNARKNNGLIKIITGIRLAGKSYLLNEIFYKEPKLDVSTSVNDDLFFVDDMYTHRKDF